MVTDSYILSSLDCPVPGYCCHKCTASCIQCCLQIEVPEELRQACADAMTQLSMEGSSFTGVDSVLDAVKLVWASKWGERAHRACSFLGIPISSIHMSVVLQPLVRPTIAFVSHSRDPRTVQKASQCMGKPLMYVEAVSGLGESLVGNVAGQPLSFTADPHVMIDALLDAVRSGRVANPGLQCLKTSPPTSEQGQGAGQVVLSEWLSKLPDDDLAKAAECLQIEAAPSKIWSVQPCPESAAQQHDKGRPAWSYAMIARSASNMEDLQQYSGAGVFDSFPTADTEYCVAYNGNCWSHGYNNLEKRMILMALATLEVQVCLGDGDVDVEGVLDCHEHVVVVQARPQV
jgi:hypothetical protein